MRDLNYLTERYSYKWSKQCKATFKKALILKEKIQPSDYLAHSKEKREIENELDDLINETLPDKHKELITFQKRLNKHGDYIFTFLYRFEVPPDNNASERAIRNFKVKLKVLGQFKSETGANVFAILRSVIDTAIKRK